MTLRYVIHRGIVALVVVCSIKAPDISALKKNEILHLGSGTLVCKDGNDCKNTHKTEVTLVKDISEVKKDHRNLIDMHLNDGINLISSDESVGVAWRTKGQAAVSLLVKGSDGMFEALINEPLPKDAIDLLRSADILKFRLAGNSMGGVAHLVKALAGASICIDNGAECGKTLNLEDLQKKHDLALTENIEIVNSLEKPEKFKAVLVKEVNISNTPQKLASDFGCGQGVLDKEGWTKCRKRECRFFKGSSDCEVFVSSKKKSQYEVWLNKSYVVNLIEDVMREVMQEIRTHTGSAKPFSVSWNNNPPSPEYAGQEQ
eukprot:GHVS01029318.1.p1 GENE.GHVS01029318.1~~GHVS01029318.1.p1  ORF type:complete len:316 (+),score=17.01 GHVS01029318.1:142-1089(+)